VERAGDGQRDHLHGAGSVSPGRTNALRMPAMWPENDDVARAQQVRRLRACPPPRGLRRRVCSTSSRSHAEDADHRQLDAAVSGNPALRAARAPARRGSPDSRNPSRRQIRAPCTRSRLQTGRRGRQLFTSSGESCFKTAREQRERLETNTKRRLTVDRVVSPVSARRAVRVHSEIQVR
jgi:hypothetical protein